MSQIIKKYKISGSIKAIDNYGNMFRIYPKKEGRVLICPEMEDGLWSDVWNGAFDQYNVGKPEEVGVNVENFYRYHSSQNLKEYLEAAYRYYDEGEFMWGDELEWVEKNLAVKDEKDVRTMHEDLKNFFFDV